MKLRVAASVLLAGAVLAGCSRGECVAVDENGRSIVPAGPGPTSWFLCWDTVDRAWPGGKYTVVGMPHVMPSGATNVRGLEQCVNPQLGSEGSTEAS